MSLTTSKDPEENEMITTVLRALSISIFAAALFACGGGDGIGSVQSRAWFEPEVIDFGMLRVNDGKEEIVRLKTTGIGSARIDAVSFEEHGDSYSARNAEKTLLGSFLSPNGTADVAVIFTPSEQGDLATTMIVRMEDAEARLTLKGSSRLRLPALPEVSPSSIDFGQVEVGRTIVEPFTLVNTGEEPGILREVLPKSPSDNEPFAITRRGGGNPIGVEIPPDRSVTIEMSAHFVSNVVGTFEEDLELVFDGDKTATLRVRGSAVPAGQLQCESAELDFGPVERGGSLQRTVRCTVMGGAFTISRIGPTSTSSPLFSVPNPPSRVAPNGVLEFVVQFDARGVAQEHAGVIQVLSQSGMETRIDVRAAVIPPTANTTDLSITLTWDTDQTDFDVHLVRTGGAPFDGVNDCYYAAKNPDWGVANETLDDPFLDNDNTRGFGPEQINLTTAAETEFDIFVHFYNYGSSRPPPTNLSMQVSLRGVDLGVFNQTLDFCGGTWHVGKVYFNESPPRFTSDSLITSAYRNRASTRCQ
jgi:hypothetical protein